MRYKKGNEKKRLINNEIVRVRDNKKRDLLLIFVFVFAALTLLLFYLWQRLGNVELAYKIDSLKKKNTQQSRKRITVCGSNSRASATLIGFFKLPRPVWEWLSLKKMKSS